MHVLDARRKRHIEMSRKSLIFGFHQKRIGVRCGICRGSLFESENALSASDCRQSGVLSFPLFSVLYLEADTVPAHVKPRHGQGESAMSTLEYRKCQRHRDKTLRLANRLTGIRVVKRARGLNEEESKWQSTAGITLRFLSHYVVRRCSFRRASCPRLVAGNIEEVPFLSFSLSFFFTFSPRGLRFSSGRLHFAAHCSAQTAFFE